MIYINLTYGFGNNLFQFHFGRIISKRLKVNYACVGKVSVHFIKYRTELPLDHVIIRDNYKNGKKKDISKVNDEIIYNKDKNILLLGFFEYRNFFIENRDEIINFHKQNDFIFTKNNFEVNKNLNIIHIRLNNRLVSLNHALNWLDPNKIFEYLFDNFPNIKQWNIVSDFNFFSNDIEKDILELMKELKNGPNKYSFLIGKKHSYKYALKWVEAIKQNKNRIIFNSSKFQSNIDFLNSSGGLKNDFLDDFQLLMSAENIMFWGSTFSWWASFLSKKSNTIIGSPWRLDRKPEYDPALDKIKLKEVINMKISDLRYVEHKKNSYIIMMYDKIPYSLRGLYSKILNYINKKIKSLI